MMINGIDYSLPLLAVVSFLALFGGQFLLLHLKRLRWLRHLPWVWVIGILVLAVAALVDGSSTWFDLKLFFFALLCGYAAICAAGIVVAHLMYKLKTK